VLRGAPLLPLCGVRGVHPRVASPPLFPLLPPPFFCSRLSVVSSNKNIEGIATIGAAEAEETASHMGEHVVKAYAGVSKKGYAPYNPRKRNQDALLMEEHKSTGTLVFGVFDGHGEAGDLVSHYFTDRLPPRLFANPHFGSDSGSAMREEVDRLEKQLLAGARGDGGRGKAGTACIPQARPDPPPPNSPYPPHTHSPPSPSLPLQTLALTPSSAAAPACLGLCGGGR
jgi:hypothetical protein